MLMCLTLSFSDACFLTLGLRFNVRGSAALLATHVWEVVWILDAQDLEIVLYMSSDTSQYSKK